jgi:hypothetical protein
MSTDGHMNQSVIVLALRRQSTLNPTCDLRIMTDADVDLLAQEAALHRRVQEGIAQLMINNGKILIYLGIVESSDICIEQVISR